MSLQMFYYILDVKTHTFYTKRKKWETEEEGIHYLWLFEQEEEAKRYIKDYLRLRNVFEQKDIQVKKVRLYKKEEEKDN